jgi:hypothetical protein
LANEIEKGDDVLVRGEVVWIEDDGFLRVRFPGHQYPATINPDAIEQVTKPQEPKARRKPLRDVPD